MSRRIYAYARNLASVPHGALRPSLLPYRADGSICMIPTMLPSGSFT